MSVLEKSYLKIIVLWDVASCCLVEVYRRFRGASCLHHQGDESPPNDNNNTSLGSYDGLGMYLVCGGR
jgi:hypothetical protein